MEQISRFDFQPKELCFEEWCDVKTGVKGFISVFGSRSMPAAGGGIRVSPNLDMNDAGIIAQRMRQKFNLTGPGDSMSGLPINGAGIILQARPEEVTPDLLIRFMQENNFVERGIGTAASTGINTDGVCEALCISHLQEPIALALRVDLGRARRSLALTQQRIKAPVSQRHARPTDVATGFSAAEIVHDLHSPLEMKKIGIIGFGACGGAFAAQAIDLGAEIVWIANSQGAALTTFLNSFNRVFAAIQQRATEPLPRLHLESIEDNGSIISLSSLLSHVNIDVLVLAGPEGAVTQELVALIPNNITIVSLANKPFGADVDEAAIERRTNFVPARLCNLGNAVLFSLADLGCRAQDADDLLDRSIACSLQLAGKAKFVGMGEPIWHKTVTNFIE